MYDKICKNSQCFSPRFKTLIKRKKYCSARCRNQSNYIIKNNEYAWEINMQKLREKNIKILEDLFKKGFVTNYESTLLRHGFSFNASYFAVENDKGNRFFRYGNLGLEQMEKNENPSKSIYKIIKFF